MSRQDSFRRSVAPLAVTGVLGAVGTFALDALVDGSTAATLHWLLAGLVTLASLWFLRGLLADRPLLRARDDRLVSEYLAGALLGALFSALAGTPVGVAVCAVAVLALALARRDTADAEGPAGRDLRNAALVALSGGMLLLGVVECFDVWAQWSLGVGSPDAGRTAWAEDRGAGPVGLVLLVVAVVAALAVPAAQVRHRARLREVRFTAIAVSAAPVAVGAMSGSAVLVGVGLASALLALVLSVVAGERDPSGRPGRTAAGR